LSCRAQEQGKEGVRKKACRVGAVRGENLDNGFEVITKCPVRGGGRKKEANIVTITFTGPNGRVWEEDEPA